MQREWLCFLAAKTCNRERMFMLGPLAFGGLQPDQMRTFLLRLHALSRKLCEAIQV